MSNYFHAIYGQGGAPAPEPVDLSPVLLWENPSPTAEFNTQTISLGLSEYAGVIVEINANTNTSNYPTCTRVYCKKGDNDYFGGGAVPGSAPLARTLRITDEGVFFGNGFAGDSVSNGAGIPTKIYGVKEYVVEPVGQLKNVTEVYDLSVSGNGATKTFTATKKGSYLVQGPGYSAERVTLTTTGETLFNESQSWFVINLNMSDTITCKSLSSGSYTCNVYLLE